METFLRRSVFRCSRQTCVCAERILGAASETLRTQMGYDSLTSAIQHQNKCRILSPWPTDDLYTGDINRRASRAESPKKM